MAKTGWESDALRPFACSTDPIHDLTLCTVSQTCPLVLRNRRDIQPSEESSYLKFSRLGLVLSDRIPQMHQVQPHHSSVKPQGHNPKSKHKNPSSPWYARAGFKCSNNLMVFEFFLGRNRKNVEAAVAIAMIDLGKMITVKPGYNREFLATVWL